VRAARFAVALLIGILATANAVAADDVRQDLQQWTAVRISNPIGERWTYPRTVKKPQPTDSYR